MDKIIIIPKDVKIIHRGAGYPVKETKPPVPSFELEHFKGIRNYCIEKYGEEKGNEIADWFLNHEKKLHEADIRDIDIRHIIRITVFIINDILSYNDIVDVNISSKLEQLKNIYTEENIDKTFRVFKTLVNRYPHVFDDCVKAYYNDLLNEIEELYNLRERTGYSCFLMGHKFRDDKYLINDERCVKCCRRKSRA